MLSIVSIIIPAYNCEKHIEQTIDSVKKQTYSMENLEVIIVNDGSTDSTADILAKYDHEYIVIHTKNQGVSAARNEGLRHATGKFIQFLDSDDILLPDKIKNQVELLIDNKADVAYGIWQKFIEIDNEIKVIETIDRKIEGMQEIAIFSDFWCPPASILYSRNIVDKIGGFKTWLEMVEDARFLLDAALQGAKFCYSSKLTALYRTGNNNSLSRIDELKFVYCCYKNAISINEIWKEQYAYQPEKKAAVIDCLRTCINMSSILDKKLFELSLNKLLKIEPFYIPEHDGVLKTLSKIIGYRNTEKIARIKRILIK